MWRAKFVFSGVIVLSVFVAVISLFPASLWATNLAEVNGVGISESEVKASVRIYLKQIGHDTLSPGRLLILKNKVLKRHIEEELLYQEATERGLLVSDDDIRMAVSRIKDRFFSDEAYEAALVRETLKSEDIWSGARRSALIQKAWHLFSDMNENDRSKQLKTLSQEADIVFLEALPEANRSQGTSD